MILLEETTGQHPLITNAMKLSYEAASRILITSMTHQQKATECSLRILGKHPFIEAEIRV